MPRTSRKRSKDTRTANAGSAPAEEAKLTILVSSTVYGHEDLLDGIHALLSGYGYQVMMSHKGTIPVDPNHSAMDDCLRAVENCDLFLGIILPEYGSGRETADARSITHREALKAIELNKPRWFLVHEHVVVARQLLGPMRDETKKPRFVLKEGIPFARTPVLGDLRVLELYESAMQHQVETVADRRGNWVQTFGTDDDARLFATAQFRRHRELLEKHLRRLEDTAAIRVLAKREPNEL